MDNTDVPASLWGVEMRVGDDRANRLGCFADGTFALEFVAPAAEDERIEGGARPRATVRIDEQGRIITGVCLSRESVLVLRMLLNDLERLEAGGGE